MAIIRISRLTRGARCAASLATCEDAYATGVPREVSSDASMLGRAYHRLQQHQAEGEEVGPVLLARVASLQSVDLEALTWLWKRTPREQLEPTWSRAEWTLEYPLREGWTLRGTCDLARYWEPAGYLEVIDWKTGRLDEGAAHENAQLRAYAALAADYVQRVEQKPVKRVRCVLHYVRDLGEPDAYETNDAGAKVLLDETLALAERLIDQHALRPADREYRVGEHCRWLDCRRICPAYRAEVLHALNVLGTGTLTTANAVSVHERVKLIEKIVEGVGKGLKELVEIMGPIEADDGRILEFRPQQRRPPVNLEMIREAAQAEHIVPPLIDKLVERLENRERREVQVFSLYKKPRQA